MRVFNAKSNRKHGKWRALFVTVVLAAAMLAACTVFADDEPLYSENISILGAESSGLITVGSNYLTLQYELDDENCSTDNVQWISDNENVVALSEADIDRGITVEGVGAGVAHITVKQEQPDGTIITSEPATIYVKNLGIYSILMHECKEMSLGQNSSVRASLEFDENQTAEDDNVIWTSSDESIASIDDSFCYDTTAQAYIEPKKEGTVKIKACAANNMDLIYDEIEVKVVDPFKTAAPMEVNQNYNVVFSDDKYEKYFSFTPSEDGLYTFASADGEDADPYAELYIYDENYQMIAEGDDEDDSYDFSITCSLEEGKTYYLRTSIYADPNSSFSVSVVKREGSFFLNQVSESYTYYGNPIILAPDLYVIKEAELTYRWYDANDQELSSEEMYTVDENILNEYETTIYCDISDGTNVETVTFYIYLDNDDDDDDEVDASQFADPIVMQLNQSYTVNFEGEKKCYSFTPETSGKYRFYSLDDQGTDPYGWLYQLYTYDDEEDEYDQIARNDDEYDDLNFGITVDLEGGITYYLLAGACDSDEYGTYKVQVEQAVIYLPDIYYNNRVVIGDTIELNTWAEAEGNLSYRWYDTTGKTLSTDEIFNYKVPNTNTIYCEVKCGSASKTVEFNFWAVNNKSGEIKEGTALTLDLKDNVYPLYKFTAGKSGTYTFYSISLDDQVDPFIELYSDDKATEWLDRNDDTEDDDDVESLNYKLEYDLEEGQTVYLLIGNYKPGTIQAKVVFGEKADQDIAAEQKEAKAKAEADAKAKADAEAKAKADADAKAKADAAAKAKAEADAKAKAAEQARIKAAAIAKYQKAENAAKALKVKKLKVKAKSGKKAKVTWKATKNSSGYQIQYSTNKKFKKGNKTVSVNGANKKKATIKKLKVGKTYYVRIRTYTNVKDANGKTVKVYGKWTKGKKIKAN